MVTRDSGAWGPAAEVHGSAVHRLIDSGRSVAQVACELKPRKIPLRKRVASERLHSGAPTAAPAPPPRPGGQDPEDPGALAGVGRQYRFGGSPSTFMPRAARLRRTGSPISRPRWRSPGSARTRSHARSTPRPPESLRRCRLSTGSRRTCLRPGPPRCGVGPGQHVSAPGCRQPLPVHDPTHSRRDAGLGEPAVGAAVFTRARGGRHHRQFRAPKPLHRPWQGPGLRSARAAAIDGSERRGCRDSAGAESPWPISPSGLEMAPRTRRHRPNCIRWCDGTA